MSQTSNPEDKDALINAIGQRIVNDTKVNAQPWDAYALVVWYGSDQCVLSGYRYRRDGSHDAATPEDSAALQGLFDQLRVATRRPGEDPWSACVVRIVKSSRKITVDFEYDDPERWHVQPGTATEVAIRARPVL